MGTLGKSTGGEVGRGEVVLFPVQRQWKPKIISAKHFQCWEQKAESGNPTAPVTVSQWPVHTGTGALLERCVSREQQHRQWMP